MSGVAAALREKKPGVKIGVTDPMGSGVFSYFREGEPRCEGSSIVEGVGVSFVPGNLAGLEVDFACQVSDEEGLPYIYDLLKEEGLCVGGSSAINIAGAVKLAEELGPGHTIVTILCDSGARYASKLFKAEFLWSHKLPYPEWIAA